MSIASTFGKPLAFYGLDGPGAVTDCPDCALPADALFGDHGGDCLDFIKVALPHSALGIIHRHALRNRHFSANDVRAAMDDQDIAGPKRGPAFAAAERRKWIEHDGYVKSTDGPTKGHPVSTYQSLIYTPRTAAERAQEASA